MPADHPTSSIVHNDYRFDNVILDSNNPMQIIGVLDWELTTLGDPLMDLGNTLAYWIEADDPAPVQLMRRQPSHAPGMLTRREVRRLLRRALGIRIDNFDFYYTYGLFRLAGIVQQIYYRFYHGQTQDKRFAQFIHMNKLLEHMSLQVIAKSSPDGPYQGTPMSKTQLFDLDGKIAFVSGASRGIGEAIAKLLAQQGAHVIVSSRKLEGCQHVADAIIAAGGKATAVACHIGEMEQISQVFAGIKEQFGRPISW
jgi:hypothetical protein